jgi:hypothetical protein
MHGLSPGRQQYIRFLKEHGSRETLVVTNIQAVAVWSTLYSDARTWWAHWAVTPSAEDRKAEVKALFKEGKTLPAWEGQEVWAVMDAWQEPEFLAAFTQAHPGRAPTLLLRNRELVLYLLNPPKERN